MARISLVIADSDEFYVESMVNFLAINHSKRFQVYSFSKQSLLVDFLGQADGNADILLISPELYYQTLPKERLRSVILLSSGNPVRDIDGLPIVNKYQHAEKLVNQITGIFAESNENEVFITSGSRQSKLVAVYSPCGGAGRTSVALGASIQCGLSGLSAFYLNLESINSIADLMDIDHDRSLSKVFYYLKEKSKNLALKIEGTKSINPKYNFHYFSPPDSGVEVNEMTADELVTLVRQIKAMGQYNYIFIDMSSTIDARNLALLEACDHILMVVTPDQLCNFKVKAFTREVRIHLKNSAGIFDKTMMVLNKCSDNMEHIAEDIDFGGRGVEVKISETRELQTLGNIEVLADVSTGFGKGISELIKRLGSGKG